MSHVVVASLLTVVLGGAPAGPAAEPVAEAVPTSEPPPTTEVAPAPETAAPQSPPVSSPAPVSEPMLEPTPASEVTPSPEPVPSSSATSVPATQPGSSTAPEPIGPLAAREREIQQDPELGRQDRQATNLVITGSVGVGFGLATLLLVSAPMHAFYRDSLDEAEETRWVTSQDELIQDALYRRRIMLISAGVGAGLTTVGAVILAVGLSQRARLRRPQDTLSLAPTVGGGQLGVAASLRF